LSQQWKKDQDEGKSARILTEEASQRGANSGSIYTIEPIPLHDEQGFLAIAFALPEILQKWDSKIHEVSLDSACVSISFSILKKD